MGWASAEWINTEDNTVSILKDGVRETYRREYCDGHGLYRSPLGGRKYVIPQGDTLWLCRECCELYIRGANKW